MYYTCIYIPYMLTCYSYALHHKYHMLDVRQRGKFSFYTWLRKFHFRAYIKYVCHFHMPNFHISNIFLQNTPDLPFCRKVVLVLYQYLSCKQQWICLYVYKTHIHIHSCLLFYLWLWMALGWDFESNERHVVYPWRRHDLYTGVPVV